MDKLLLVEILTTDSDGTWLPYHLPEPELLLVLQLKYLKSNIL